ncbi:MAG: hypothetical protein LBQ91_01835 [Oscillospiraceae bacterium]|nr:hypothetical protein [Oscillospiraceae bacterium]
MVKRIVAASIGGLALLAVISAVVYYFFYTDKLKPETDAPKIEYGEPLPAPAAWFSRCNHEYIIANAAEILTDVPGVYEVVLQRAGAENADALRSKLTVADSTAPEVVTKKVYALLGETITPDEFIESVNDVSPVTTEFAAAPDLTITGNTEISVVVKDLYGNEVVVSGFYSIIEIKDVVIYDYESKSEFAVTDFADEFGASQLDVVSKPTAEELQKPGEYTAVFKYGERQLTVPVTVMDSTPPTATPRDITIFQGQRPGAIEFATGIEDASAVTGEYITEPVWDNFGDQQVAVRLKDAYENVFEFSAKLTVNQDKTPPAIVGAADREVMKGEKVAFKKGIIVTDNSGVELELEVDSTGFDASVPGKYSITYTATDLAGNSASVKKNITVTEADVSLVDAYVDKAITALKLEENQPAPEKLKAVYQYVRKYLKPIVETSDDGVYQTAYAAFTNAKADCRGYSAMSSVIFDRLGFENLIIHTKTHTWNLVKINDKWYFYDAMERNWQKEDLYMFGQKKADEVAQLHADEMKKDKPYYYNFDKTLYPKVEEE